MKIIGLYFEIRDDYAKLMSTEVSNIDNKLTH